MRQQKIKSNRKIDISSIILDFLSESSIIREKSIINFIALPFGWELVSLAGHKVALQKTPGRPPRRFYSPFSLNC